MVSYVKYLKCSRCGKVYYLDQKPIVCENKDLGRLDIYYDYEKVKEVFSKHILKGRRFYMWRYRELMPVREDKNIVTLGEGGTPLIKAKRLAEELKVKNLYLKDETRNPTGSFKDRGMSVAVSMAVEFGYKVTVTASSGNAAAALAAYSAKAGLETYAFVIEEAGYGKVAQLLFYGAKVFRVKGLGKEDPTVKMMKLTYEKYGWYPSPSFGPFNPYQIEGPKTISYEVVEQLNWNIPDWVMVPVGAAALLTSVWKGFRDFKELGFIDNLPRLAAIQSTGNPPFVRAWKEKAEPFKIKPWPKPETIATGLEDPYPWDHDGGLKALQETNGVAEEVSDELILKAMKMLAKYEGIFAEPSGVASLAGYMRLLEEGIIDRGDTVVVLITGHGLKDPDIVKKVSGDAPKIEPKLEDFERALSERYA
ncbi:MAG: threonine synthase [Desulfurococcales archaeon ex4484_217_2]|nr:MAG: threonine synthase [Desulfurococcales archaeon ex4484_217_2]